MNRIIPLICGILLVFRAAVSVSAAEMPEFDPSVTDVTVFKDGHALILSKAETTLEDGWCRTRGMPEPVLGTFWSFVTDKNAKVDRVKAGFVETVEERPCLSFEEIIQANRYHQVSIIERFEGADPIVHEGKIMGILEHEAEEDVETARQTPGGYDRYGRWRGNENVRETQTKMICKQAPFVVMETDEGTRLIKIENIKGINLKEDDPIMTHEDKKKVRELTMHVVSSARSSSSPKKAEVGLVYLQKGIRWIPRYNIELLDNGKAKLSLSGVIVNDIADLENVNLRLVVGVPSFIMKDNLSPMALRDVSTRLSMYFQPPGRGAQGGQYAQYFYNALTSQVAMPGPEPGAEMGGGPDIPSEGQNEDLFLYEVKGFTLGKGERAVVDLISVTVPYEDIYTWDIPPLPPREMWRHINEDQQRQLANALTAAKAMHELRLENTGEVPWTTGPAMIFKDGALLGQQLVTYTSVGNKVDVPVTIATDLNTKKEETETGRTPNIKISGYDYTKVAMHGKLTIRNFKDRAVKIEVRRMALGFATSASANGKIVQGNALEDTSVFDGGYFWYYWRWPYWWYSANGLSEITWKTTIEPGESTTFEYDWYYHYRH